MDSIKKMFDSFVNGFKNIKHTVTEILSALLIVLLINTFLVQNYQVPTGSMIPKIMPGDRLFANRVAYGLKLPFTDGLLGYRLPKLMNPKRGDLIVFRSPASAYYGCEYAKPYYEPSVFVQMLKLPLFIFSLTPFSWDPRLLVVDWIGQKLTGGNHIIVSPILFGLKAVDIDPRKEFVKRVIASAGETIELKGQNIYIDGEKIEDKWGYFFYGDRTYVDVVDNYGPVYIPKKGDVILFKKLEDREDYYNDLNTFEVYVNDKLAHEHVKLWYWMNIYIPYAKGGPDEFVYNVPEDYFFAMGDNRDQSCDSRMWGLIPYRQLKGQPMIAWVQSKRPNDVPQGYFRYFIIK